MKPLRKTVAFSKAAVNVFFHILTKCNLSCRHCYINPDEHGQYTLSIETIQKWLKLFGDPKREVNVVFLGGEPTLHPQLAQAIHSAKEIGYHSITVDTNGYLFHDILDKVSPDEVDYFSFSIDGAMEKTNDHLRGEGSYKACTQGLLRAVEKGFATSVIYTVSSANLHELDRMPALLAKWGINRFFIQVLGIRGKWDANEESLNQVSQKEWLDVVPQVAEKAAKMGIIVTYPKVFLKPDEPIRVCPGWWRKTILSFPNGRVYRCPLCEDYPIHAHELVDDGLKATPKINENDLFYLSIPEGCVMNKLIQPQNISYDAEGNCIHKIACCLLKEEVRPE